MYVTVLRGAAGNRVCVGGRKIVSAARPVGTKRNETKRKRVVVHKNNDGGSSGTRTYRTAGTRTRVSPAPSPPFGARRWAATEASPLVGGRPGGAPSCVTGSLANIRHARSDRLPKLTQEKNSDRNESENHFAKTFPKTFPKMEEASPRHRARPPGAAYVVGYAGMQKERGGHAKGVVCASLCVGASEKSVTEGSKNQNVEILGKRPKISQDGASPIDPDGCPGASRSLFDQKIGSLDR